VNCHPGHLGRDEFTIFHENFCIIRRSALPGPGAPPRPSLGTHSIALENGTALIDNDAHIWPGKPTTAMASFLWAARKLKPAALA
jgi:hypothetical protein